MTEPAFYPTQDDMIDYLRQLENQNAHHASRDSAEWAEYQSVMDALGISPEISSEEGAIWNDHTQAYEKIIESDTTKAHGVVQRRIQRADFSRQYRAYRTANEHRDAARRLSGGVYNPADDPAADVRGSSGGDHNESPGSGVRSDEIERSEPAGPGQ